jgi:hypothetical protein
MLVFVVFALMTISHCSWITAANKCSEGVCLHMHVFNVPAFVVPSDTHEQRGTLLLVLHILCVSVCSVWDCVHVPSLFPLCLHPKSCSTKNLCEAGSEGERTAALESCRSACICMYWWAPSHRGKPWLCKPRLKWI